MTKFDHQAHSCYPFIKTDPSGYFKCFILSNILSFHLLFSKAQIKPKRRRWSLFLSGIFQPQGKASCLPACGLPCWFKCEARVTMTCDFPVRTLSGCCGFPAVSLVVWPLKGLAVGTTQTQFRESNLWARIMAFPSGKLPRYICIPPIPYVNPGGLRKVFLKISVSAYTHQVDFDSYYGF